MSTNSERLFISKIAHSGNVDRMISEGIRSEHFSNEEREIWDWIVDYHVKYGTNPSLSTLKNQFPDYYFESTSDSLPFLKERFIAEFERKEVWDGLFEISKIIDDHNYSGPISELLFEKWKEINLKLPTTAKIHSFNDMILRYEDYQKNKAVGELPGIPMGISAIDELTMGIQMNDYVTVFGFTGTGKSTLVQWMLLNAYMDGKTPLFISLEMEPRALMRKWDTMMTHFNYNRLKQLNLTEEEEKKYERVAKEVKAGKANIQAVGDIFNCTTETIYGLACRQKPDLIAIDYITLMDHKKGKGMSMWESVTELSRELKMLARSMNIPIIGVAQTNRGAANQDPTMAEMAYSHSINQDSDIVMALGHRTDEMKSNHQAKVILSKNRDGAIGESSLRWRMDTMEFGEWRDNDAFSGRGSNGNSGGDVHSVQPSDGMEAQQLAMPGMSI